MAGRFQYHLREPVGPANPLVQPGEMAYYPVSAIPAGWLKADGSYYAPADQPALYQAIGYRHGKDGQNRFRVPELIDFIQPCNPNLGDVPFVNVADDIRTHGQNGGTVPSGGSHQHAIPLLDWKLYQYNYTIIQPDNWDGRAGSGGAMSILQSGNHAHTVQASGGGGVETAPKHTVMVLCICALGDFLGYVG